MKNRLENIQSKIKNACFVLSLQSIIEDLENCQIDIIDFINECKKNHFITNDMFVLSDVSILKHFTFSNWIKKTMSYNDFQNYEVKENEYTILKYFNPETKLNHFKRRYFDTVENSQTVKNGFIESVYIYEVLK